MDKCKTCANGYPSVSCANCGSGMSNYTPIKPFTEEPHEFWWSVWETTDESVFDDCDDAISHEIDWLKQPANEKKE